MSRKKFFLGIGALCVVAAAVLLVLKLTVWTEKSPVRIKHDPTPTIPAEIPAGSALAWRRTAIYVRENNKDERCYAKLEYDDLGRCVRVTKYPESTAEEVSTTTIVYDSVTKHAIATSDSVAGGLSYRTVTEYDTGGNVVAKKNYQQLEPDGEMLLIMDTTWWVDPFGNRVKDSEKIYSSVDGEFLSETRTFFDEAKRQRRSETRTTWDGDWSLSRTVDLDEKGRVYCIWNYVDGEKFLNARKTYDSEGRLLTDSTYDQDGILIVRKEYEYENAGDTEYSHLWAFDKNGYIVTLQDATYSEDGTKMYETRREGDETVILADNVLDGEGRIIRSETEFGVYGYDYDDYGNILKVSLYTLDGLTSVQENTYTPMVLTAGEVAQAAEYCDPTTITP